MTAVLLPNGKQQYFTTAGFPAIGYKVATFAAGTSTPQVTWQDGLKVAQNTNPIILDGRGEASIFWDGAYKVQLQDSTGAVIWTQDGLQSQQNGFASALVPAVTNTTDLGTPALSWRNGYFATNVLLGPNNVPAFDAVSGNIGYYKQTALELAAGVTPTNFSYPPGHAWRYGAVGDGVTDDTAALSRMASINFPCYIPYTSGNGYKITSTVTFSQNNIICDGQLYAVGIVSNSGQVSGSYTATNPAVIVTGNVNYVRGLFVEGDANAKANNTIGIRVDGNSHTFDRCGGSNLGWGCVVNGFIMQFTNCYFGFNNTGMTMWGGSVLTGINSIIVSGGTYGGNINYALNIGDTRFSSSASPRGAAIRLEGFNCDNAPIQVDNVVAFSARNIYFEYGSLGTVGFILGGSGANNLRGCDIDSCFFNGMKFAVQCLNSVSGLKVGRANFYTGVTISAVKYLDMTQGAHYESGANSGSFGNGQEVGYNFPGQNISTLNWGGITSDKDSLVNGTQIVPTLAPTKWFPGGMVVGATGNTRTVNTSSSQGVFYTSPTVSKAGTLSSNQLTMTTKSDSFFFNGGDRLTGTGAASGVAICLGVDYDNGIVTIDVSGSGAATISQVAVTTATETIP